MAEKDVLKTIEVWSEQEKTPAHILAGVKVRRNWVSGKEVTLKEYQVAVNGFVKGPLRGV